LGAGKTTFVQGFAKGLGIGEEHYVRSPTFTLMQEYRGRLPLYHFDFYRLTNALEVENIGFEDYLDSAGVIVVEWADKFPTLLPSARLHIVIAMPQPDQRDICCTAFGEAYKRYVCSAP
jgi:tRNA threonylcarbamoyladenosine biosynthesis protein TsaE